MIDFFLTKKFVVTNVSYVNLKYQIIRIFLGMHYVKAKGNFTDIFQRS